jgi:small-conductance mechanosensitive channel
MKFNLLWNITVALFIVISGVTLFASEVDEFRERAKAMRTKAASLGKQGNNEQALRLMKESTELLEMAGKIESNSSSRFGNEAGLGIDRETFQLKDRLQDLLTKERSMREDKATDSELGKVREEIADIERALHKKHSQHAERVEHRPEFRAQIERLDRGGQRVHHLRVAAEHLKLAEEHDTAHKLMEKAEEMERDIRVAKQELTSNMRSESGHNNAGWPEVITQLKEENERLRAELRELKQNLDKR